MSQETITLSAEKRDAQGTRAVRRLRSEGKLPAVVYGHGEGAVNISLPTKETVREINAGHAVFDLNIDGKSESVLLKDVQYNYLGDEILHLDFFRVNLGEEVTTDVPLVLT
ncbi:MAG: 50S ribosomal protein L25, partial [Planctomycetota bacterium]